MRQLIRVLVQIWDIHIIGWTNNDNFVERMNSFIVWISEDNAAHTLHYFVDGRKWYCGIILIYLIQLPSVFAFIRRSFITIRWNCFLISGDMFVFHWKKRFILPVTSSAQEMCFILSKNCMNTANVWCRCTKHVKTKTCLAPRIVNMFSFFLPSRIHLSWKPPSLIEHSSRRSDFPRSQTTWHSIYFGIRLALCARTNTTLPHILR